MGIDLHLRAFPENCELWAKARVDRQIAENMPAFAAFVTRPGPFAREPDNETDRYFMQAAQQLVRDYPGLLERHYMNESRAWDRIVYLLSPNRRTPDAPGPDNSLIHQAIRGIERLQPEAVAVQGEPIMVVPTNSVNPLAEYLHSITRDQLHEYYDPAQMDKLRVYKMWRDAGEELFNHTWNEFTRISDLYQQAAVHNEAMIVFLD
jgi:hypothetical protein